MPSDDRRTVQALEQQNAVLREQLMQAQRLTALGELTSTTTHEFNNVLTTIINYAKIGLRHQDQPTRDKAFDKILTAANRASRIANGVLGAARNRSNEREPTELGTLIDESLVLLEREMQKYRIQIERQLEPVPRVIVCANQIQQVLLNLLINARQAMGNGGRIVIKTGWDATHGMVDLVVRDTGSGIPQDRLPRIFDRFFTTKQGPDASGKGGTGLGLATCRDIIESHRGRIRVESTVGKGTAITLKLPAEKVPDGSRAPGRAPALDAGTPPAMDVTGHGNV